MRWPKPKNLFYNIAFSIFMWKNHLLYLKDNKDIGQLLMKPVFYFEMTITFFALKTIKCCKKKDCSSKKVGIG